jgi:hypothetical protein
MSKYFYTLQFFITLENIQQSMARTPFLGVGTHLSRAANIRHLSGLRPFDRVRTLTIPVEGKTPKLCSPDEAVKDIKSGFFSNERC